ncbi:MAG: acyl-CoA synthetase [Betaproteobacteria bacterium]|nr:acyl-CoA synthetase [Betaproteobacteria bacterium]
MSGSLLIRNLRDIQALESAPLSSRYSVSNTYELLTQSARKFADLAALVFLPQGLADEPAYTVSYAGLFARTTQAANAFSRLGIGQDEVIAFVLPNLPETHYTIWGGEAAGIVAAVNPLLEPRQILEILVAVKAKLLVTLGPDPGAPGLWEKVKAIAGEVPSLKVILQIDITKYFAPSRKPQSSAESRIGSIEVLNFDVELDREPGDRLSNGRAIRPEDVASMFHTGGTTGAPKIAPHTHANEVFMAWSLSSILDMAPGKTFLCGLPLFHVNAVLVTGLAEFMSGATVLMAGVQGYRSSKVLPGFWKLVERFRVNYFSAVPTIYARLLDVPAGDADISCLVYAICGAAPMPIDVFRKFEALTGVKILEGYGMTEGTCASVINPPGGERRIGSIGLPMPYQQVKLVILGADGTIEREASTGEIGVVVMHGPQVFPGYLRAHDNESAWITDTERRKWLNTGDLGRMDEDGYIWLAGRAKDLIIRGGHNIDPQIIEDALCRHPAVAFAAAVGQPDAYAGEIPVCYVVLREGMKTTEAELIAFAKTAVPERAAAPARISIVDTLPVTAVGKIFKPALRYRATEDVLSAVLRNNGIAAKVTAGADPRHGTVAKIHLQERAQLEAAREILGRFTVHWELES